LRRLSKVDTIDISDKLDYLVIKEFSKAEAFFKDKGKIKKPLSWWRDYIETRLANLVFSRRFDLSATGTRLLAYCSSIPFAATKIFWCIKGLKQEQNKILALWFNSTLNLLQVFLTRMETRGAFMNYDKYVLESSFVLDTEKLDSKNRRLLLQLFDKIKDIKFPSLLDQLRKKHPQRVELDKTIMRAIGFNDEKIDQILDYLYPALTKEIEKLKTLMEG
jgi:hypothetical protein